MLNTNRRERPESGPARRRPDRAGAAHSDHSPDRSGRRSRHHEHGVATSISRQLAPTTVEICPVMAQRAARVGRWSRKRANTPRISGMSAKIGQRSSTRRTARSRTLRRRLLWCQHDSTLSWDQCLHQSRDGSIAKPARSSRPASSSDPPSKQARRRSRQGPAALHPTSSTECSTTSTTAKHHEPLDTDHPHGAAMRSLMPMSDCSHGRRGSVFGEPACPELQTRCFRAAVAGLGECENRQYGGARCPPKRTKL